MKLKLKSNVKLEFFEPVSIKLLKNLSDIEPGYLGTDEDIEAGYLMELELNPSTVYLCRSNMCYISDSDLIFEEGIDFEFE